MSSNIIYGSKKLVVITLNYVFGDNPNSLIRKEKKEENKTCETKGIREDFT